MDRQAARQAGLVETQRLAGIGVLAASVAHELNNPISIITTTCGDLTAQLENEKLNAETLQRQLDMIEQSAWRCARLIQTLRSYAHPDSQPVLTPINALIANGLTLVAYQFQRQYNVTLVEDLGADLPVGLWEPNQITQVLLNLLINARDALQPHGGTVRVRSWLVDQGAADPRVAFAVEDDGPGIPDADVPYIFDPFFTTKPVGEGTGLGLSIAADIVTAHGGRIWYEPAPGGGACFIVELPSTPPERQEPSLRPAPSEAEV